MKKNFSERLKEFSDKHDLSELAMAIILGISQRMYRDYADGKFQGTEGRIHNYMERLKEWEKQKAEDAAGPSMVNEAKPLYRPPKGNIIYVPLVAYGGFLQGYADKDFTKDLERFTLPGIHGEHWAFEVQGNSMTPYARPGDVVIARKEERLDWMLKGRAYVLQTVDGIIVKLFDKMHEGRAYFKSADKDGNSPAIPLKEIKGVYQVVKVLKDFMNAN